MIGTAIADALSGTVNPERWMVDWITQGRKTSSGETINESTALTCAAVYAANRVLGETLACLPLDVFRNLPNGGKEPAPNLRQQRMLHDEPNKETTSFIFRETLQVHLGTWGNGYAEIQRSFDGTPQALWQRSPKPQHTKPVRRDDVDGEIWYQLHDDVGTETWVKAENMFHVPGLGFDGLIGYSPISLMKDPIGVNKAAERYAGELFANDARPNGYITMPAGPAMNDKAYERTKKAFQSGSERGSRHKLQILEGGATYATAQMNPEDVQMIEARKFGIEEIARVYRIPPPLLQDLTHGTFSNVTELGRQFIKFTMLPWIKRWQEEINRKLLPPDHFAKFNTRAFLQGDPKQEAEFATKMFMMGESTVNEIRELHDKNPIGPDGDVHFVPANLIPLELAIKGPPNPKAPPPAQGNDDTPPEKDGETEDQRANSTAVIRARFDRQDEKDEERHEERHDELFGSQLVGRHETIMARGEAERAENAAELRHLEQIAGRADLKATVVTVGTNALIVSGEIKDHVRRLVDGVAGLDDRITVIGADDVSQKWLGQRAWEIATRELLTKEGKFAERAAAVGGNFLKSIDGFYEKHADLCLAKFEIASLALAVPVCYLAQTHIDQSREALLMAAECKADKLTESVARCVEQWADKRELSMGDKDETG
jgi:HK97 family phage portal protein